AAVRAAGATTAPADATAPCVRCLNPDAVDEKALKAAQCDPNGGPVTLLATVHPEARLAMRTRVLVLSVVTDAVSPRANARLTPTNAADLMVGEVRSRRCFPCKAHPI
ncbi:hypothetical protein N9L76_09615, partial [bacterium]|nr:hypothetical protein [bacterium]